MNLLPHHFADPEAPLSLRHLPAFAPTQAAVHVLQQGCSACNGNCPTPAACELPIAQATRPPALAFWLEPLITRAPKRFAGACMALFVLACYVLGAWLGDGQI